MEKIKVYDDNSIVSLRDEDKVRLKPSVIFGTNDEYGAAHGIYEIIANAIDEAREGYAKKIRVKFEEDGTVEVEDDGRGVPMGWNEAEKKWNWELVFTTLYASGKYDASNYGDSLGTNGLGATAMQYASEFMEVYSTRAGKTSIMNFAKGKPVGEMKVEDAGDRNSGTLIRFKPDRDVFINIVSSALPAEHYLTLLRRQAMLHEGLEIVLDHFQLEKPMVLKYTNGPSDYINDIIERPMIKQNIGFEGSASGTDDAERNPEHYTVEMRMTFNFSREVSQLELYHNGSHLFEGGVSLDAFRFGITKAFDEYAKDTGKIQRADKFIFKDIEGILVAVIDTGAPGSRTFFKNQTKGAINNPFIRKSLQEFVYYQVKSWLNNDKTSEHVVNEVVANKTAREEADKVSKRVVQSLSRSVGFGNKPKKFVDCKIKDVEQREIYIVEGDSALGSVKLSRDASFQGIMPVRGKIINCLKEDLTRILSSEIIIDLLRVLGCGIEVESEFIENLPEFDMNKLNWGKIMICTDADLDGYQIRCLILAMFYRLMPSVLKSGKVYIAETPLFEISHKKDTFFAYDVKEKEEIVGKLIGEGAKESAIKIQRSKGLGENDPKMMSLTTMKPESRRLIQVEYKENEEEVKYYFNALLGDDIEQRRYLINKFFDTVDLSID